jgi:Zn-dependent protease with chaperone function
MYFLLGICLIFALLWTLNLLASLSASVLWRAIARPAARLSSRRQEQIIFSLRVFPIGAAVVFVAAFLVPAYVLFEPFSSGERVSLKLALISLGSLLGIGFAAYRVIRTWLVTRRLTASWMRHSEPISVDDVNIPVYRIRHPFPVIAVVGMFRPRMFVASQIFDSLSADEFRAAIAHEYGHLNAHDNFKRAFLRFCRDMLILPLGRDLDRAWTDNTEAAADEYAARTGGDTMALDLASTLIKIARIAPENARPAMMLGSFLIDGHEADLKHRVGKLLEISDSHAPAQTATTASRLNSIWLYLGIAITAVALLASNKALLLAIHNASENIVSILQ